MIVEKEAIKKEKIKVKKKSQIGSIWQRYRKNKLAMAGLTLLVLLIVLAIMAPLFADYQEDVVSQNMANRLKTPNKDNIFGTDHYGRDIFGRIVFGARVSLSVGLASVVISSFFGLLIGSIAGYYGGVIDNILMRIMDVLLAIPSIFLAITIVAALGPGLINLLIAISISYIPGFSRIVRSSVLSIKNQEFVEAARACGTKDSRIILKHIIPNAVGPIIVQVTLSIARAIIHVSSLSFLGLGIKAPMPEWGSMLAEGKSYMGEYQYLVIIPGIAIVMSVMALNLIGDGLRDALDPRLKN